MRRLLLVLPLVMLVATGCIRSRPNTRPEPAALDVPPPPPRVIVPVEPAEQPADETAATEPEEKERRPTRPRSTPRPERAETAKPPETKPETPAPEAAKPATPPAPLPSLQPVLPGSPSEMDRRVRDQLAQASRDLQRIDYRVLNADGKSQYDTAKRFIEQAGQALSEKNLVFAQRLAEKAVGLASNLVPR